MGDMADFWEDPPLRDDPGDGFDEGFRKGMESGGGATAHSKGDPTIDKDIEKMLLTCLGVVHLPFLKDRKIWIDLSGIELATAQIHQLISKKIIEEMEQMTTWLTINKFGIKKFRPLPVFNQEQISYIEDRIKELEEGEDTSSHITGEEKV